MDSPYHIYVTESSSEDEIRHDDILNTDFIQDSSPTKNDIETQKTPPPYPQGAPVVGSKAFRDKNMKSSETFGAKNLDTDNLYYSSAIEGHGHRFPPEYQNFDPISCTTGPLFPAYEATQSTLSLTMPGNQHDEAAPSACADPVDLQLCQLPQAYCRPSTVASAAEPDLIKAGVQANAHALADNTLHSTEERQTAVSTLTGSSHRQSGPNIYFPYDPRLWSPQSSMKNHGEESSRHLDSAGDKFPCPNGLECSMAASTDQSRTESYINDASNGIRNEFHNSFSTAPRFSAAFTPCNADIQGTKLMEPFRAKSLGDGANDLFPSINIQNSGTNDPLSAAMQKTALVDIPQNIPAALQTANPTEVDGQDETGQPSSYKACLCDDQKTDWCQSQSQGAGTATTQQAVHGSSSPAAVSIPQPVGALHYSACFSTCNYTDRSRRYATTNCFVQRLVPLQTCKNPIPILFIHGDHHTGQVWQHCPDPNQTPWVQRFLQQGYPVYVPDMPVSGRSMGALMAREQRLPKEWTVNQVEGELTCPDSNTIKLYDMAQYHDQFPGVQETQDKDMNVAGTRHDPYFLNYLASRVPVWHSPKERIALGAEAISSILDCIGEPVIIVAEGTGAAAALQAADRTPDRVAGLAMMGYPYAPFATPFQRLRFDNGEGRLFHHDAPARAEDMRGGITPLPLRYDPPLGPADSLAAAEAANEHGDRCLLQGGASAPRRLASLATVPLLVVTPEAGANSAYDWAVVAFLRQAGAAPAWLQLAHHGLRGNGQLLWLERNSDAAAALVRAWVVTKTPGAAADDVARAAAALQPRPDHVTCAAERAARARGTTARSLARYREAWEQRDQAWARREIAPVTADVHQVEGFYTWLPVLDHARAAWQAAKLAEAVPRLEDIRGARVPSFRLTIAATAASDDENEVEPRKKKSKKASALVSLSSDASPTVRLSARRSRK